MNDSGDRPGWKRALRAVVPATIRAWMYNIYAVRPQKAWTALNDALGRPIARGPAWPHMRGPWRRVLMVAQRYNNGREKDGDSYEYAHIYPALQGIVTEVRFFDSLDTPAGRSREQVQQALRQEIGRWKPDLVFIMPLRHELSLSFVRRLSEESGAVTLAWFSDDVWRFDIFSRDWARAVHAIASQDERALRLWKRLGHEHQYLAHFGYNPHLFKPVRAPMEYPVSFVGAAGHPGRREAIEYLRRQDVGVQCFGSGWPAGTFADLSRLPRIFAGSRINLNFSHVSAPWESRRQIKGRVFEVTGCGGFLLTEYAPGLEDLFEIGKEIEVFRTHEQMLEKIQYYLTHEKERAAIARAGRVRAERDHTYAKRLNRLLQEIAADRPK